MYYAFCTASFGLPLLTFTMHRYFLHLQKYLFKATYFSENSMPNNDVAILGKILQLSQKEWFQFIPDIPDALTIFF